MPPIIVLVACVLPSVLPSHLCLVCKENSASLDAAFGYSSNLWLLAQSSSSRVIFLEPPTGLGGRDLNWESRIGYTTKPNRNPSLPRPQGTSVCPCLNDGSSL